jgi:arginine deiminase
MDITKLNMMELKALAFDESQNLEKAQRNLNILKNQMRQLELSNMPKMSSKKVKKSKSKTPVIKTKVKKKDNKDKK